ncbi:unnamed protein product [Adineta ricciae]|uniref:Uncharacterized protein n=1 Tax=Adineta ricciae TaxID=249248 RepID=A0A814YVV7_ADIRI|nr:unnamed protein product [Adineta ricciae]CAF1311659.1 unnamed protein product [Adineta ricciae]
MNSPCIQEDQNDQSNVICLCPKCHFGSICQHNTRLLSFSLDSLFANDILSNSVRSQHQFITLYIVILVVVLIFGFFNNISCFVTFRRPKPRRVIYYDVVPDPKYTKTSTWCTMQYYQHLSIYSQTITIFNYMIPCLINFLSVLILIVAVTCKRANVNRKQSCMKVFQQYKDLFIPSIFIILSALPQFIISFSLACTQFLEVPWQRYLIITFYFLSYLPQTTNYILFILPSKFYQTEFEQTSFAQILNTLKSKLTCH